MSATLPEELLSLLACPKCKGDLVRLPDPEGFGCRPCRLFYPVNEGIPDFLLEDALPWGGADVPPPGARR